MYVSDWIDPRVGGHQDLDDTLSGAIYRIAPKGFVSKVPAFDAATIEGLITALRSPAVNVRAIGFNGLKARGAAAVDAVAALLDDPNPYMRGRAIYLLYQLGPEGRQRAGAPESHADPAMRIAAYRAMRRAGLDVMPVAARLARDADPGVRREVALSMRDQSAAGRSTCWSTSRAASTGRTAATSRRSARAPRARSRRSTIGCGASSRVHRPDRMARHVRVDRVAAARAGGGDGAVGTRAVGELSRAERRLAMDTLAFIDGPRRVDGDAQAGRAEQPAARAGDVVAAEPHVEQLGEPQPAAGAEGAPASTTPTTIALKEAIVPRPAANLPELPMERGHAPDRRCGARQGRRRRAA